MSELDNAFSFLRQRLTSDATIAAGVGARIYEDQMPDNPSGTVYPFIIIAFQEPDDLTGVNNQRCSVSAETLIYVVGLGTDSGLAALANQIDSLLHGASGGKVIYCTRVRPFRRSGWVDKVNYRNLGGFYRLDIGV